MSAYICPECGSSLRYQADILGRIDRDNGQATDWSVTVFIDCLNCDWVADDEFEHKLANINIIEIGGE